MGAYVTGPRPDLPYVDEFSTRLNLSVIDKAVLSHCIETYTMPPARGQGYRDYREVLKARGLVTWQTVAATLKEPLERILQEEVANEKGSARGRAIVVKKYAQSGAKGILNILISAKGLQQKVPAPISSEQWEVLQGNQLSFDRVIGAVAACARRELQAKRSRS